MIVPDINVLLYAQVTGFREHERARTWWEGLLSGGGDVGLVLPVIFGFLRIATGGRAFDPPMEVDRGLALVGSWLERPGVHLLVPGPRHLDICFEILSELGVAGNLTTDVQIAAYAIESRGQVHSNDTDFGRIPGVRWVDPLAG